MSRMAMIPSLLPCKLEKVLHPIGDFYICSDFSEDLVRPPVIKIGEYIYYRFMNFLYLPQPPETLSPEKVIEICDLRLEYLNKLVNFEHNRRIVTAISDYLLMIYPNINSSIDKVTALDFGCGSGLSSQLILEHFPHMDMKGVDISEKAVRRAKEQGLTSILTYPDEPLPFEDGSFNLIFAIFVMHFAIDTATLAELKRVLRPTGKYVFNLFQRDIDEVKQQLMRADFNVVEIVNEIGETGASHKIISCGILPD
jgi:SAM-dependent methyltransferase